MFDMRTGFRTALYFCAGHDWKYAAIISGAAFYSPVSLFMSRKSSVMHHAPAIPTRM